VKQQHLRRVGNRLWVHCAAACLLAFCASAPVLAQFGGGPPPGPPKTPKESAPFDVTGYWVALVTEDWRFRAVTAPKGDFPNVPLSPAGRTLAAAWDPAADKGDNACKAFGAAAIMRMPARLHIQWADERTLKVDIDAGQQSRVFNFGIAASDTTQDKTWQGKSQARWAMIARQAAGSLEVITTGLRSGYLLRNGVPYSENAVVKEYIDVVNEPNGVQLLLVQTVVQDPTYLQRPYVTSSHFRRQATDAGWDPKPCSAP
jgi:hypothetical protein